MPRQIDNTIERYVCPQCGDSCFVATRCFRCGLTMVDRASLPDWEASRDITAYPSAILWSVATSIVMTLLAWTPLALACSAGAWELLSWLIAIAEVMSLFSLILGPLASRSIVRRRVGAVATRRLEATPLTPIRSAPNDACTRIRGSAHVIKAALHPTRRDCVAFHQHHSAFERAGGEFEVCDGSGARAIVKAEHVVIENGSFVPDGARIEVLGDARWVAEQDDVAAHGGPRDAARCLSLTGTEERPIVIRVLEAGEDGPMGTPSGNVAVASPDAETIPSEEVCPTRVRIALPDANETSSADSCPAPADERVTIVSRSRSDRSA